MEESDHDSDQFHKGSKHESRSGAESSVLNNAEEQEGQGGREGPKKPSENRGEGINDEARLDRRNAGEVTETGEFSMGDVDAKEELLKFYPYGLTNGDQQDTRSDQGLGSYPRRQWKKPEYYLSGYATIVPSKNLLSLEPDPNSLSEALSCPDADHWKREADVDLESLHQHGIWEIITRKNGIRPLTTKLMFVRKRDEMGRVVRQKARLVVRRFEQGKVDRTFASVVDFSTVRTCLSIALMNSFFIKQM